MSDDLEEILSGIVSLARFRVGRETYSCDGFRELQEMPWVRMSALGSAGIDLPSADFARLVNVLERLLDPFADSDGIIGSNLVTIVTGTKVETSVEQFARDLVRSAALSGPSRSVALLRGWLAGRPIHYERFVALRGFAFFPENGQLAIVPGVNLVRLPVEFEDLRRVVPEDLLGPMDVLGGGGASLSPGQQLRGRPALRVCAKAEPVFYDPGSPVAWPDFAHRSLHVSEDFVSAFALACDSPVEQTFAWEHFDPDVQSFDLRRWEVGSQSRAHGLFGPPPTPALTAEAIETVRTLIPRLNGLDGNIRIAIHRWRKSKEARAVAGKLIELRIALEALYTSDGGPEVGFRLSSRGARHLEDGFDKRKRLFRDLKKFYGKASVAVHGKDLKMSETDVARVEKIQAVCRRAILRILSEGPLDLNKLTLA